MLKITIIIENIEHEKDLSFSNTLTQIMKDRKMKSKDVYEAIGVKQPLFSKIKRGDIKPKKETIEKLNNFFNYKFA